jgi:6-phosphogluconolactonase
MRQSRSIAAPMVAALTALSSVLLSTPAEASGTSGAVYVLSNQPSGNAVIEYVRSADGHLAPRASHPTGGVGTGGGLGSQGAVILDRANRYLFAVNSGSDSISSFRIDREGLEHLSTVPSGGARPTSVTVHDSVLYVLNAGESGNISGFTIKNGHLAPLAGSIRPLSGSTTSPAQVSFTPNGRQLVVTERATNRLGFYDVGRNGLASGPTVAASAGVTPFGFDFDNKGHLIVSEAFAGAPDGSAVSSYDLVDGSAVVVSPSIATTETAACWVVTTNNGKFAYSGNAGTNSITGFGVADDGELTLLTPDGKTAAAAAGVTDLATSENGKYLYARLGNGTVGAYTIHASGSLTPLATAGGLPAGAAGIAAR